LASLPRDADVSWVHRITSSFSQVLGALLRLGSQLIGRIAGSWAQAVEWLHDRLGPAFYVSVFMLPWLCKRAVTATVDLRSLHAGLVWLGVVGLALTPLGTAVALTTAMFAAVGLVTGWWSARSLGALVATTIWNTTVFGVDLLTGIDGTRPSSIAMVSFALATDILLFAKPAGVAFRVAELAGRWSWVGSAYLSVGRAADAALPVIMKASGPIDFLKGLLVLQPSDCTRVVPRQGRLMTVVTRTLDVVTIPWRGASIAAPGPVIDGATGVGEWSAEHMALRVSGDPRTTELIRDAMNPGLRAVRHLPDPRRRTQHDRRGRWRRTTDVAAACTRASG
jgi:hypothetical protein